MLAFTSIQYSLGFGKEKKSGIILSIHDFLSIKTPTKNHGLEIYKTTITQESDCYNKTPQYVHG
jgi:hypothetical protein